MGLMKPRRKCIRCCGTAATASGSYNELAAWKAGLGQQCEGKYSTGFEAQERTPVQIVDGNTVPRRRIVHTFPAQSLFRGQGANAAKGTGIRRKKRDAGRAQLDDVNPCFGFVLGSFSGVKQCVQRVWARPRAFRSCPEHESFPPVATKIFNGHANRPAAQKFFRSIQAAQQQRLFQRGAKSARKVGECQHSAREQTPPAFSARRQRRDDGDCGGFIALRQNIRLLCGPETLASIDERLEMRGQGVEINGRCNKQRGRVA